MLLPACLICFTTVLAQDDPYLWLEDVEGEKALEFVKAQNKATLDKLSKEKEYGDIYRKSLEIYNSKDKIPYPSTLGKYVYNFWQDDVHKRGIWRRATKQSYNSRQPVWETVLDIDKISEEDDIKWVFQGATGLYPAYDRFLISLSKGGSDAIVIKEFDAGKKAFIENGFSLPEAKTEVSYIDKSTLIVATDFGEGTMTASGYPRQVKIWRRGEALQKARLIYECGKEDVSVFASVIKNDGAQYILTGRYKTTFTSETFLWQNGRLIKLNIPNDSQISGIMKGQLVISLKSDWKVNGKVFMQGSLISLNLPLLLKGEKKIQTIYQPNEWTSIAGVNNTKSKLLVALLNNVKNELYQYSFEKGIWKKEKVKAPDLGTISVTDADLLSDEYYFIYSNFLTPTTLYTANAATGTLKVCRSLPALFDASRYKVEQFKAKSKDGTLVPYFLVSAKDMKPDSSTPTLLYAYGGFEVPSLPYYSSVIGNAWLNNGGAFVLANIRGGGEFGPKWHQAGLKEKRQNVYDDFHSVAEDLVAKKITSSRHLGIMGGSNGGLLVGVAFTQRPDLYNAVVCQVPLLDMKRYNKLLAGASWMGEYGNPDIPEEWAYIQKYSPYQNLKQGVKYPEVFFYTSTRDDRVHPGHARKMAAKMAGFGMPVFYYENMEGGHGGSSTPEQRARETAMQYAYFLMKLRSRR